MAECIDITEEKRMELRNSCVERIVYNLQNRHVTDLGDIGNMIGDAIASVTHKDGKDQEFWSFQKDDFILGLEHGYSLHDGTH